MYKTSPCKLDEIKLEVTYECPLACVHCSSDAHPGCNLQMEEDSCVRILGEAANLGVRSVAFSGGEPLVWPYIMKCVEFAGTLFDDVDMYTTGNVDAFQEKVRELKGCGLSRMIFSVYAASEAVHDRITRVAQSYSRTIDALAFADSIGLATEIHFVLTSHNHTELRSICELARQIGANAVSVLRLVPQGRGALFDGALTKEQIRSAIASIRQLRKEGYAIRTGSPMNVFGLNDDPECKAAIDRLIVSPDLRVSPCDAFKQVDAEKIAGTSDESSLRCRPLQECWTQSPYLNRVREVLGSTPTGNCAACANFANCGTGCLAQKYIASGVLSRTPDPDCLRS